MKLRKILLMSLVFSASITFSNADELNTKLDKVAQKIALVAAEKGLSGATLAVFPLQTDQKLKKKKVDFATGEILGHYLLKTTKFTMVERAQLETVIKEQKLGAAGVIDANTAAGIGKILGAKLLVTGNVIKLGDYYQIAIKLIDSETAEIVTSEIAEIGVEVFDKEAAPYLVLVPKSQAIGFFIGGYGQIGATVKGIPQQIGNTIFIPAYQNGSYNSIYSENYGIRYWFHSRYMVQVDYAYVRMENRLDYDKTYFPGGYTRYSTHLTYGYRGNIARIGINRTGHLSKIFNWNAGIGVARYTGGLRNVIVAGSNPLVGDYQISSVAHSVKFTSPFLRAGVEWRPQQRFGWNISANWNILSKTVRGPAEYYYSTSSPWTTQKSYHDMVKAVIPQLNVESSLALYF